MLPTPTHPHTPHTPHTHSQTSTSGGKKVKLTGIMVSEEPGQNAYKNWAAWDWVSIAASKSTDGVFNMANTAHRRHRQLAELAAQGAAARAEAAAGRGGSATADGAARDTAWAVAGEDADAEVAAGVEEM